MKFLRYTFLTVILLVVWVSASAQKKTTRQEYIARYATLAIEQQALYGIPASITLAQGILESGNGNSRLATKANNHFGIKCGGQWDGKYIRHDDDEKHECFRSYDNPKESYIDHSLFLVERKRYSALFELDLYDYKGWAKGLKTAGYATNPAYADLLIKIIEANKLHEFDHSKLPSYGSIKEKQKILAENKKSVDTFTKKKVKRKKEKKVVVLPPRLPEVINIDNLIISLSPTGGYDIYSKNNTRYVISKYGDTVKQIAKKVGVSRAKLRRINSLKSSSDIITEGTIIYLERESKAKS